MHDYKKLGVWQESITLVTEIYELTDNFPDKEKFNLINQLNRAAVSLPSNIAEGAGRLTEKDFVKFLGYANGSGYEVETQLIIAYNLQYITNEQKDEILNKLTIIQRKIYRLIKSLQK